MKLDDIKTVEISEFLKTVESKNNYVIAKKIAEHFNLDTVPSVLEIAEILEIA